MTLKTKATKEKLEKVNYIKINFCASKDTINTMKATHRMEENI
jgi:hypothetical protein